jgi:small-conductance mechanosensitive channel
MPFLRSARRTLTFAAFSLAASGVTSPRTPLAAQAVAPAPQPDTPQQAVTIEERLDSLLASQAAINRRLDSLTTAPPGAPAATPSAAAASAQVLNQAGERVRSFGYGVVWSIILVTLFNFTIRGLVWVLDALAERNASRRLVYKRIVPIARIVLWVFAAYLIVSVIFEVDAQGLLAAAAAVGVAVGFAAQDLLKNLFGGIILVFDQPFQVGDKISVGGTYGEVKSIGLRSTRIVTPDDNLVSVPNAQVVDQQVANANAGELNCQVVTDLYLPGWPDEAAVKRIAFDAAASSKYVYLNKPIVVLVADQFNERVVTRVRVKAYVLDPRLEFLFQSDVTERARAGFREVGLLDQASVWPELVGGSQALPSGHATEGPERNG